MSELVTRAATEFDGNGVQLRSFDDAARFAKAVFDSGLAPGSFKNAQAVLVAMQAGMELGMPPMRAIQSIAVIGGKPTLWGDAALAMANMSGLMLEFSESIEGEGDARKAVCKIVRKDGRSVEKTFSVADAKRADLWNKGGPWKSYPERMLQMRARGFALRDAVPEALCGFYLREEMVGVAAAREVAPSPGADPLMARLTIPEEEVATVDGGMPLLDATDENTNLSEAAV